ncbi:MAG: hypothetical protein K1X63_15200 [Chitinophagales bacterium]|nr:hypothetical protein [Bacteroidota bacterium]MBX7142418.1 hypothetical protein [Chitinophagales bacterium]
MIIHVLKFSAKPGKEKTVHKIIRGCMMVLKDKAHPGTSFHSLRDATDRRHFIQISTFETKEAEEQFENIDELKRQFSRLQNVVEGALDYRKVESFEFFQAR